MKYWVQLAKFIFLLCLSHYKYTHIENIKCNNLLSLNQAVHVAAQYGQTTFLNHIISKYGVDFDALDNDGRSPLHWYAKLFL